MVVMTDLTKVPCPSSMPPHTTRRATCCSRVLRAHTDRCCLARTMRCCARFTAAHSGTHSRSLPGCPKRPTASGSSTPLTPRSTTRSWRSGCPVSFDLARPQKRLKPCRVTDDVLAAPFSILFYYLQGRCGPPGLCRHFVLISVLSDRVSCAYGPGMHTPCG